MPILGNLSEFPLPEILTLIGRRTGKMRLLDVPADGILELHIAHGFVLSLQSGSQSLETPEQIVQKLSYVVQGCCGMFEFNHRPIHEMRGTCAFPLQELVMQLVFEVDEMNGRRQRMQAPGTNYKLTDVDEIWLEPALQVFFDQTKPALAGGSTVEQLAEIANLAEDQVRVHLGNLQTIGMVVPMPERTHNSTIKEMLKRTASLRRTAEQFLTPPALPLSKTA